MLPVTTQHLIIEFTTDGANRTRTGDFHNAIVTLYQLSYSPLSSVYYHALKRRL